MGASVNKVFLLGRLGADPELRYVGDRQRPVTKFSIATDESWKVGDEWKSKTQWTRVVVWGKFAEICAARLVKGQQVFVEGRLQTSSFTPKGSDKPKYSTEVVADNVEFLARPGESAKPTTDELPDLGPFGEDDIPF